MDRLELAKNYAASCNSPHIFFCIEANGMCHRPDQYCDKDHQRIGECFKPEQSEEVHLQFCKDNHGNVSALKDPQCIGACSYRFNNTFIANEEPVDSYWELDGWFVVFCCLIGIVIVVLACFCIGFSYWKRWKQSQSHVYKPAAEDPESGVVIKPQPNTQQGYEEAVAAETTPLTQDDGGETLVRIVNLHQGSVGYNPAISTSHSNLSDGSNRREPSSDNGRSGSACAGDTSSPASMPNQFPETNSSENDKIVTNMSTYELHH